MENNAKNQNPTQVEEQTKRISYDQLMADNQKLLEIRRQLIERMQMMDMSNTFKRLEILFKVVENADIFHSEFVEKCVNEIEELVTIPEEAKVNPEGQPEKSE